MAQRQMIARSSVVYVMNDVEDGRDNKDDDGDDGGGRDGIFMDVLYVTEGYYMCEKAVGTLA